MKPANGLSNAALHVKAVWTKPQGTDEQTNNRTIEPRSDDVVTDEVEREYGRMILIDKN
jgi:hypothetical protein